jgi:hypothetical protein
MLTDCQQRRLQCCFNAFNALDVPPFSHTHTGPGTLPAHMCGLPPPPPQHTNLRTLRCPTPHLHTLRGPPPPTFTTCVATQACSLCQLPAAAAAAAEPGVLPQSVPSSQIMTPLQFCQSIRPYLPCKLPAAAAPGVLLHCMHILCHPFTASKTPLPSARPCPRTYHANLQQQRPACCDAFNAAF